MCEFEFTHNESFSKNNLKGEEVEYIQQYHYNPIAFKLTVVIENKEAILLTAFFVLILMFTICVEIVLNKKLD